MKLCFDGNVSRSKFIDTSSTIMLPSERGCVQNADGSLKEAHEIDFQFSRSASPVDLSAPSAPNATPEELHSAVNAAQQAPAHGKVPKKKGRKPKIVTNNRRAITGALPPSRQRYALPYKDKIEILNFIKGEGLGWRQKEIAAHFRKKLNHPTLNQSTISTIKSDKDFLRSMEKKSEAELTFMRPRRTRLPILEDALRIWHLQAETQMVVTSAMLIAKGQQLAKALEIPDNEVIKFSQGWLDSYKQRYGYRMHRFHGEAKSCSPKDVAAARALMIQIFKDYTPECIYNMDETGLFYRFPPDRGLATTQTSGLKVDKTRITLGFTANADGSDKRQPFIIGKARKPRCFNKKEGTALGFEYYWNKSAWMMGSICQVSVLEFHSINQ